MVVVLAAVTVAMEGGSTKGQTSTSTTSGSSSQPQPKPKSSVRDDWSELDRVAASVRFLEFTECYQMSLLEGVRLSMSGMTSMEWGANGFIRRI
ncbi:hypothetical protein GGS21DRAFT_489265 [Xylaria nigripes]|nr:hypothetical protein GGS21DRAFT_489265 [Xylaria nigripes]